MSSSMFALWAAALIGTGGPVTGVSVSPAAERTQILIAVDGEVEYRDFTMEGPNRLVIDIIRRTDGEPIWRGVYRDDEQTGSKLVTRLPEDAKKLVRQYPGLK